MWSICRTQRQVLHSTDRVGMAKTESAKMTINALNPEVQVRAYNERLTTDNVMDIFRDYDIIVDGCDNFPTQHLPVRGPGKRLQAARGAMLSLPVPHATSSRHGAVVK